MSLQTVIFAINQILPEPHAGLLLGILYGTKATLSPEFKQALITTGTLHIVALSGMNITILISLTATTLSHIFSRRIVSLLTLSIIIGFILFVGVSPSVIRAALMGSFVLVSTILGRRTRALYLLLIASGLMLAIVPLWLFDVSFQLSFLATLGLVLFTKVPASVSPHGNKSTTKVIARRVKEYILDDLHTTFSAQIFTIPLMFFQFHQLSFISPVSNLLIGWMIPPLTMMGLLLSVLAVLWLPLSIPLSWITWVLLEYVLFVIRTLSSIPFAGIKW